MDDCQDVEIGRRFDTVDNQVWQSSNLELAGVWNFPGMAEQRKLLEHQHCLTNARDYTLGGEFVIGCDPNPDGMQVVSRLRREINVQGRIRAKPVGRG